MNIIISNSSDKPIYEQIVTQIKNNILTGAVAPGEMLPSIRFLAKELRISTITTKRAYDELEAEGYIETVTGKGTFVSNQNKELLREEQLKRLENKLTEALDIAKMAGVSKEEVLEMLTFLCEE